MKIDIKEITKKLIGMVNKHPVFLRVITQGVMFITTFGLHNSSPFWHVVCLVSMCLMSVFTISDGKLRKASIEKSEQVVEILQDAISDMIESGGIEVSENFQEIFDETNADNIDKEN